MNAGLPSASDRHIRSWRARLARRLIALVPSMRKVVNGLLAAQRG